jgi:hypothetical protein
MAAATADTIGQILSWSPILLTKGHTHLHDFFGVLLQPVAAHPFSLTSAPSHLACQKLTEFQQSNQNRKQQMSQFWPTNNTLSWLLD